MTGVQTCALPIYFRDHSNWKIPIKGWLTQLDRRRFELFGYHTGARTCRVPDAPGRIVAAEGGCVGSAGGPWPLWIFGLQIAGEVYWAGIHAMLDSRPKST